MKIRIILLTIIALTSIVILFLPLTINPKIIEKLNSENYNYSYTKAICDGENFCQDYEIICEGNKTIQKNPPSPRITIIITTIKLTDTPPSPSPPPGSARPWR